MNTAIEWFKSELELIDITLKNGGSDYPQYHELKAKMYKEAISALENKKREIDNDLCY